MANKRAWKLDPEALRRKLELRRSGAAGKHSKKRNRHAERKAAIKEQTE